MTHTFWAGVGFILVVSPEVPGVVQLQWYYADPLPWLAPSPLPRVESHTHKYLKPHRPLGAQKKTMGFVSPNDFGGNTVGTLEHRSPMSLATLRVAGPLSAVCPNLPPPPEVAPGLGGLACPPSWRNPQPPPMGEGMSPTAGAPCAVCRVLRKNQVPAV